MNKTDKRALKRQLDELEAEITWQAHCGQLPWITYKEKIRPLLTDMKESMRGF